MRLLLDAHVLLWALGEHARLSPSTREAIRSPSSGVWVSSATVWEIEIKRATGRLDASDRLLEKIVESGFDELAVTFAHATAAGRLPPHHGDPFDRMLVAQAQLEGLTIVSDDARIGSYQVAVMPAS
jgi:PIN domain nuclease of toxin-antitoxin system